LFQGGPKGSVGVVQGEKGRPPKDEEPQKKIKKDFLANFQLRDGPTMCEKELQAQKER